MEEKGEYNIDRIKSENAALRKYAIIQKETEDKVGCQKIYVDITKDLEAALVLDEIIFFTLPRGVKKSALRIWKDGYLWLAVQRADWWDRKRLTPRQADTAIKKLEDQGLVIKSVYKFNGQTTTHLRLNVVNFFRRYGEELDKNNPPEDQNDAITKDIDDLYKMMENPESQNGDSQNGETELQNGETELQNGDSINIPHQPTPTLTEDEYKDAERIIRGFYDASQFPGFKREKRIDLILSYFGGRLRINTETPRWKKFAKWVDDRQQAHGENMETFVNWLVTQKDFDIKFWSPDRMCEMWPQAFLVEEKTSESLSPERQPIPDLSIGAVPNPFPKPKSLPRTGREQS